jgi:hypothetical protein
MIHIETDGIHLIAKCLNQERKEIENPGRAHLHLILMLSSDSAIGLAKLKMATAIESLADDFII